MPKITDICNQSPDRALVICDFSPPRGISSKLLEQAEILNADWISVAYNPGKSPRISSPLAAHWIKNNVRKDVIFTIATRDMNKLAIQSLLMGASLLELDNVIVVQGDKFTRQELDSIQLVNDYSSTQLISSIKSLNEGKDFRGYQIQPSSNFCIGASVELGNDMGKEAQLTKKKIDTGADFLITQPTFDYDRPSEFIRAYESANQETLKVPLFIGIQIMVQDGVTFGPIPNWVTESISQGYSGDSIALKIISQHMQEGFRHFYLIPGIHKGGRRDYTSAKKVIDFINSIEK
tara:strand:+ start:318 stop:1193 length:876 start_codon:yes stop_codon:yes gene_type:complete